MSGLISAAASRLKASLFASGGALLVGFAQNAAGAIRRTVAAKFYERPSVLDFGAVGDWNGTTGTDDTAAIAAAFATGKPVIFPAGVKCKTTGPLTATAAVYMEDGAMIHPTGTGYTALTIRPAAKSGPWRAVVGDGNGVFVGDGIEFGDPAATGHTQITVDLLAARKCSGRGVEVNNIWESRVGEIKVYGCGKPGSYALAIKSNAADSSNLTEFGSVIVAQSDTLAASIAAQYSRINLLHVEETTTPAQKFAHLKSCVGSSIGKARIYNAGAAEAWIGSCSMEIGALDVSATLVFDNTDPLGCEHVRIGKLEASGAVKEVSPASAVAASAHISVGCGKIASLTTGTNGGANLGARWDVENCDITTLTVGRNAVGRYTRAAANAVRFENCNITTLGVSQPLDASFALEACTVAALSGGTVSGTMRIENSIIAGAFSIVGDTVSVLNSFSRIYSQGNSFAAFNATGNVVGQVINTTISGALTSTRPGTTDQGILFIGSGCAGAIDAYYNAPPSVMDALEDWGRGKSIDNIAAAVGSSKGWVRTSSAWVSKGNL